MTLFDLSSGELTRQTAPSFWAFPLRHSSAAARAREAKIHGYVTAPNWPTSFEIEDYHIRRDDSLILELENQESGTTFNLQDLRVGTLVEVRGILNVRLILNASGDEPL
jgi:hypothetical protein